MVGFLNFIVEDSWDKFQNLKIKNIDQVFSLQKSLVINNNVNVSTPNDNNKNLVNNNDNMVIETKMKKIDISKSSETPDIKKTFFPYSETVENNLMEKVGSMCVIMYKLISCAQIALEQNEMLIFREILNITALARSHVIPKLIPPSNNIKSSLKNSLGASLMELDSFMEDFYNKFSNKDSLIMVNRIEKINNYYQNKIKIKKKI